MKGTWKRVGAALLAVMMLLSLNTSIVTADGYSVDGDADKIKIKTTMDWNGSDDGLDHTVTFETALIATETTGQSSSTAIDTGAYELVDSAKPLVPVITKDFGISKTEEEANLDFSNIRFKRPGKYTFQIGEKVNNASIKTKNATTVISPYINVQYIDIYVANDLEQDVALKIVSYVVYKAPNGEKQTGDDANTMLFENMYDNYYFQVKKEVTGNQGDKVYPFTVRVRIQNELTTETITVKKVSGTPKASDSSTGTWVDLSAGDYKVSGAGGGSSSSRYIYLSLKHGDQVRIEGLNSTVEYSVLEQSVPVGYDTPTYKLGNQTITNAGSLRKIATNGELNTVTNNKHSNNIPTGLFLNNWPYILVVLVAIAGILLFLRRRKARGDNEIDL